MVRRLFCSQPPQEPLPSLRKRFMDGAHRHASKVFWIYGAIGLVILYPTGKLIFQKYQKRTVDTVKSKLNEEDSTTKILEAYLIRVIMDVLTSPEVVSKGVDFTTTVINDPKMNEELLKYLIEGLKHPAFLAEVKRLGIGLTLDILSDPDVQRDLTKLLIVFCDYPESFSRSRTAV